MNVKTGLVTAGLLGFVLFGGTGAHAASNGNAGKTGSSSLVSASSGDSFNTGLGKTGPSSGNGLAGALPEEDGLPGLGAQVSDIATSGNSLGNGVGGRTVALLAGGNPPALPVPEPSSWMMLLAGLGMVGLIARRRSSIR